MELSSSAKKALAVAGRTARDLHSSAIGSDLLLISCLGADESPANTALRRCGATRDALYAVVARLPREAAPAHDDSDRIAGPRLNHHARRILEFAYESTRTAGESGLEASHIFLAIVRYSLTPEGRHANSTLALAELKVSAVALGVELQQNLIGDSSVSIGTLFTLPHDAVRPADKSEPGGGRGIRGLFRRGSPRAPAPVAERDLGDAFHVTAAADEVAGDDVEPQELSLPAGVVLDGRYRLDERVGRGGMGEVWRGQDEALGRDVAVKVMLPSLLLIGGFAEMFRGEARTMATIKHPGVVDIYDYGSDQQLAFLVMEYVEGTPLSAVLRRAGRLTPARTMALVAQAADALQAAHTNGIVHRDVKPSNLLVRPNGTLVLTDFGIAQSPLVGSVQEGILLGTTQYMSPEQIRNEPATAASDVYALGLVAYQCLSGQRAFDGATPREIAMKHLREQARPLPADVPPPVRAIVSRAMAKDPASRWPTAAAMAAVARQAASDMTRLETPSARSTGAGIPGPKIVARGFARVGTPPGPGLAVVAAKPRRLPIARHSAAVLIGAANYTDPDVPDLPSVANNVADLAEALSVARLGGFYSRKITELVDPTMDAAELIQGAIDHNTDTALIYYAGHGFVGEDGELYLGLRGTKSAAVTLSALRYETLRRILHQCSAQNRILILDCCFSGRATGLMASNAVEAATGQIDIEGTYVLAATPGNKPAHAPPGDRNSAFTAAFLKIFRDGLANEEELLALVDIFEDLRLTLQDRSLPLPQQRGSNTVQRLALARNPRHRGSADTRA